MKWIACENKPTRRVRLTEGEGEDAVRHEAEFNEKGLAEVEDDTAAFLTAELDHVREASGPEDAADWWEPPEPEDFSQLNKEELARRAEERGLEVSRSDGSDGPPLKDDYVAALEAARQEEEGDE